MVASQAPAYQYQKAQIASEEEIDPKVKAMLKKCPEGSAIRNTTTAYMDSTNLSKNMSAQL